MSALMQVPDLPAEQNQCGGYGSGQPCPVLGASLLNSPFRGSRFGVGMSLKSSDGGMESPQEIRMMPSKETVRTPLSILPM